MKVVSPTARAVSVSSLNPQQTHAVAHATGPLLVLAGAGSGKTRVITQRIVRLIREGERPESILAVTFTNKSADEMRRRVARELGAAQAQRILLSTFHSFGVRFLGEDFTRLGLGSRFVIFDQGDTLSLLRDLVRQLPKGQENRVDVGAIAARISLWKSRCHGPSKARSDGSDYDELALELYPKYQAALADMRAVDFDDLVGKPVEILQRDPAVREKWQGRLRHILVDEFQDTSVSQLELVRLLANSMRNVCVVGDDDQSIYSWRGADVTNILDFEQHFPGAAVVKLEQNYRSTPQIIATANAVMGGAKRRHAKKLYSNRPDEEKVQLVATEDNEHQAMFVAQTIKRLAEEGIALSSMAALYRSNGQARLLEEQLRLESISYQLQGGTQYYERKEVKDAIAFLRLLVSPHDELALRRVINVPPRGLGGASLQSLERGAMRRRVSFSKHLWSPHASDDLTRHAQGGLRQFRQAIEAAEAALHEGQKLHVIAKRLFVDLQLDSDIDARAANGKMAARKRENLAFLLRSLERYESQSGNAQTLHQFLNRMALRRGEEEADEVHGITLSTLHAAKGLEYDCVFLVGCADGMLPHNQVIDPKVSAVESAGLEEERRLCYVGVTRARRRLYLVYPKTATARGRTFPLAPSRFFEGISEECVTRVEPVRNSPMESDDLAEMTRQLLSQLEGPASGKTSGKKGASA